MPTLLLIGITNILGIQILVPLGKEKYVLYSEIAGAIVDIILNALLIPFMQASGAAIGTLIAETVVFIVQFIVLKGSITTAFKKIKYWKIMLSILIGLLASLWCIYLNLGNFITLIISAFLFFLDLYSGYVHHERKACSGDIIPDFEKNPYFITASSMHS